MILAHVLEDLLSDGGSKLNILPHKCNNFYIEGARASFVLIFCEQNCTVKFVQACRSFEV